MNEHNKKIDLRYKYIITLIILLMLALAVRLFVVTVIQHESWNEVASRQSTKTIYTSAPRGNIYDRNGNLLAGNKQIFTAVFNASNLDGDEINKSALSLINKLIENGDEYTDDFPILMDGENRFRYVFDDDLSKWLSRNGYKSGTSAQQVFDATRTEYGIDKELDRYEAMKVLEEKHNVSLPINVRSMKFIYTLQKENFLKRFGFSETDIEKNISAAECFNSLRDYFNIDKKLSQEDARKIFLVRNKIVDSGSQKYMPITVAKKISKESVIYFEENGIDGVSVSSETERYYPNGKLGCHIIGYMGSISEGESKHYSEKGYLTTDLVGKDGIEAALEDKLHGKAGIKTVVVNSSGDYVSTISETESSKGGDVYLTVDLGLQSATEQALAKTIENIPSCDSGAAVVLDVKTSDVLAMASYPDFDLNAFADGISSKEWADVQSVNPRDPFAAAPLYNNATKASAAPGSTFKPITSLVALECGLNPNQRIWDKGHVDIGGRSFGCYSWNAYGKTDGYQDLEWGLGNSCNYYFACIATGKDWGNGASLGYSKEITIDAILQRAKDLGLGEKTGIEIGETVREPVSVENKMKSYKISAWNAIYNNARIYFPKEVYNDEKKLYKNIDKITSWIEENPSYAELIKRVDEQTDVKKEMVEECAQMVKFDYFNQASWGTYDLFNISIGQGDNNYTPVQIANYIASLGNHGHRNNVNLVYGVEGEGRTVKPAAKDIKISDENRAAVLKGMRRVCLSGTLATALSNYPVEVVGKTGTAQYQAVKQPKDELEYIRTNLDKINQKAGTNISWEAALAKSKELLKSDAKKYPTEYAAIDGALIELSDRKINYGIINAYKERYEDFAWIAAMAPADDPKIAIVIMLPEGGLAANAGDSVKDILDAYFKQEDKSGLPYKNTDNFGKNQLQ
ncbi:MAG: penicillin-binding transpeptidase domain-containing protein [Eubacterium sp.]|nr:penicillin-binding transpeptidase domain-containing protein [Eubacterium sp.]